jgi:hypothetical protein
MNHGTLTGEWDVYLAALREDAHLLLAWGYADARSKLPAARDEYDLTDFLANAMEQRINNPLTPDRFLLYSVHNERPISPRAELGKDRPKLDIQIERCGVRPKRFYTFEMKRLRDDAKASPTDSLAHYLGNEGVGRFVAGKYEAESFEASMIGCIQARTPEFWLELIGQAFKDDVASAQGRYNIVEGFQRCSIISELCDEASTIHRRASGSRIRLLHIFLCCGKSAS